MVVVWMMWEEETSNEMRRAKWKGKMDQEMGDQEERQMLKLRVHINLYNSVRLRLLSVMKIRSLAQWDCRRSVGDSKLQP